MKRYVKLPVDRILDTVYSCRETEDEVQERVYSVLAHLIKCLSDREIDTYANDKFLSLAAEDDGYTKEDYENCKDCLEKFRQHYLV
jgi:hypothetical protein